MDLHTLRAQFLGFLATPPLWKDRGPINIPQYLITSLPSWEKAEHDLLVPDNLVLGKRVEYFFAYYVEHFSPEVLLAQNVVIHGEKETIGEIDFLLFNEERKEYSHVELVYKFYLYAPEIKGDLDPWIGPNRQDSLQHKLHRLQNHQFPLLYREECRDLVQALQIPIVQVLQKVCFKANLFVPLNLRQQRFKGINNDCIQGFWIRIREFEEEKYGNRQFHTPKKPDWPMHPSACDTWYDYREIMEQLLPFIHAKRAPLVWMKISETEFQRFFVVWW